MFISIERIINFLGHRLGARTYNFSVFKYIESNIAPLLRNADSTFCVGLSSV